jgi:phosphatidylethanolamine N-methyltransferase
MVSGEVVFEGDKLWWTQGVFEFRYHHNGRHNVMAISQPFEIRIGKFVDDDVDTQQFLDSTALVYEKAVEGALLPVVRNCLDRDPDIAPSTGEEPFGAHVERDSKYAKRVVYAIHQMFGIEFAPAVVPADGNVKKLAWRICNAKQVLVSLEPTLLCLNRAETNHVSRPRTACLPPRAHLHLPVRKTFPSSSDVEMIGV